MMKETIKMLFELWMIGTGAMLMVLAVMAPILTLVYYILKLFGVE